MYIQTLDALRMNKTREYCILNYWTKMEISAIVAPLYLTYCAWQ